MPLPSPILDDRSYQQLRDELVRRIPVYTPEWTDHNPSDPGITLLELFAFLGENLLFRFNQIPEATQLAYLRLLQIPLRPAVSARSLLALTTEQAAGVLVPQGSVARAGAGAFETEDEVVAWPLSLRAAARLRSAEPDPVTEPEVYEFALRAVDAIAPLAAGETPVFYQSALVSADGKGAPVDFGASVDGVMWIALLSEKGYDRAALAEAVLNIGFVPDPVLPGGREIAACPGLEAADRGPAVEWQIAQVALAGGAPVYRRLSLVGDTTRGLTVEGVVRLRLPRTLDGLGIPALPADQAGSRDAPPPLEDEALAARVVFWLRAFRVDGSALPATALVCANAARVQQRVSAGAEYLGSGSGQPGQEYALVNRQVQAGSVLLQVEEAAGWSTWSEVESFAASDPDARHYVLDGEAGRVRFGSGEQGRTPHIGERIRVTGYRWGGGLAGNVPAAAIAKIEVPGVKASNPLRAWGGADAEALPLALERIPGELRRRDRAVTAADFRELALQTPGQAIGRAECLARFHAPTLTAERAGVVSVVVWPAQDARNPDAPRPDANMLGAVCAWLDARRLITTELYVIAPSYRQIALSLALRVKPGYGVEAVRRWVELALRQYLAPLPPYGPAGGGWPLGRRVHGPELEAAALQVEGVEYLEGLDLAGWDADAGWVHGTVELALHEVPALAEINVVEGASLPPAGSVLDPVGNGLTPVPLPILRDEC